MDQEIKDRLKKAREMSHLSQKDIACAIGIPVTTISKYERGTNKPSLDILTKIGSVLNVNLNWLVYGAGEVFLSDKDKLDSINFYDRMGLLERVEKTIEYVEVVLLKHKLFLTPKKKADFIRHLIEHEENTIEPLEIQLNEYEHLSKLEGKVLDLCYMIEDQFACIRDKINSENQKLK